MHSDDEIDDQQGGGKDDVDMQTGGGASGEADDKLFAKVMKDCGDTLTGYMCDDLQKVAALAATCVGASDASKSWRLLGHNKDHTTPRDIATRLIELDFSLFAAERNAYCQRWLALAAKGDAQARSLVAWRQLNPKHCACEESQVVIPSCAESPEGCLELCCDLFETLGATTENVYGEEVGYVHVDLLPFLAGDAVSSRNQSKTLMFPHVSWVKEAVDRNAFAKEVNTTDVAPERLEQFRVSWATPRDSLAKVLSVAWIKGERKIIFCVGGELIVAVLHAHCGLFKAHNEAIDLRASSRPTSRSASATRTGPSSSSSGRTFWGGRRACASRRCCGFPRASLFLDWKMSWTTSRASSGRGSSRCLR